MAGRDTCDVNSSTFAKMWEVTLPGLRFKPTLTGGSAWYQVTPEGRSKTHCSVVKRYWLKTSVSRSVWRKVHLMGSHKQYVKHDKYPVMFLGWTWSIIKGMWQWLEQTKALYSSDARKKLFGIRIRITCEIYHKHWHTRGGGPGCCPHPKKNRFSFRQDDIEGLRFYASA